MRHALAALVLLFAFVGTARADRWDSHGWVKLGEREVNGKYDHDVIEVGRYEGKFTKLTMYVEQSEIELLDFEITFGNGERYHPPVKHYFREGQRTHVIDMPGDERVIRNINLRYRNLPGGGRARVEVWGWKAEGGGGTHPFTWDNNGWVMLGEREVNGHGNMDLDRIEVGRAEGKFRKLTVVVFDGDIEMIDSEVKFANGERWKPELKHVFREGQRTRAIDLPGDQRVIKFIDFRYRNLNATGHAKVQVWAK
jgi:hypothetical protein